MFGSKGFLRDGVQVDGVLIQSEEGRAAGDAIRSYHVRVRVTFDDGTTGEFDSKLHAKDAGIQGLGAVVPVRYDRDDRSKIDIDAEEIRRRKALREKQRKDAFEATPAPLPADPTAQLQALWEQRKAMDARGSELYRSGAPREQVGAWVAEKEALDARFRALKNHHPEWKPATDAS